MGDGKEYISRPDELGNIHISEDVLAVIAAAAATEIEGVGSLSTNLSSDIAELLGGKKNLSKGIRITMVEESVRVDVSLLIKYGYTIVDVAKEVQNAVYNAIENTSGLSVENVNVHVAGIVFDKDNKYTAEDPGRRRPGSLVRFGRTAPGKGAGIWSLILN